MDTPQTLAADLLKAAGGALAVTRLVVQKGALNIKTEAKANVLKSAPSRNAHAHEAITYETEIKAATIGAEIGYDKNERGGALGNLLEYGSENNPPHRDLGRALDAEEPRFEKALGDAVERLL